MHVCVAQFSGGFLFTAAEQGFGLRPEKVQECGLWIWGYTGLPLPTLLITWQGVAEMIVATAWGVCCGVAVESTHWLGVIFMLLKKIPGVQPSSLGFVVDTGAGEGGWRHSLSYQRLFG